MVYAETRIQQNETQIILWDFEIKQNTSSELEDETVLINKKKKHQRQRELAAN